MPALPSSADHMHEEQREVTPAQMERVANDALSRELGRHRAPESTLLATSQEDQSPASPEVSGTQQGFRGPQVCAIVGITYRQLDYWGRTDLLRPSLSDTRGSGDRRLYSYRDLLELKVIKQLLDAGLNLREARNAIDCLRKSDGDFVTANLVLSAGGAILARTGEEIVVLLRGGQGVFNIVPLANVVAEIDAAIVALTR
ncbi:MAG: putative transcriptional regulator [Acidimicrobiaceae bacterium]|nr:putative transcriptional regulator [Acidimicrobiaceae bacterium]